MIAPKEINWEVLIVDNNSTDDTKKVVNDFIEAGRPHFKYFFEGRQGKTFALNTGLRKAKGNILAFTDDDVIVTKNWLIKIKETAEKYPNCKAFGGRVIPRLPDKIPKWIVRKGPYKNTGSPLVDHDYGDGVKSYHEPGMYAPCGANMFFKKEIFLEYGYFKENLNARLKNIPMCEDTEFCFRLLVNKEEVLYIPDAIIYHITNDGRLSKNYFRKNSFKIGRASVLIYENPKSGRKLFNVPLYIYRFIAKNLFKYAIAILTFNYQKIFFYELKLFRLIGSFYEHLNYKKEETK